MTSARTDVADAPPLPASGDTAAFDHLASNDLARLTLGFYFIFWGGLVVLVTLCEALTGLTLRMLHATILGAGSVAMTVGAWRLHQVNALGDAWRRRTRETLILMGLVSYLCPFFLMWRRVPVNLYLLGHALVLLAAFCYSMAVCCQLVAVLARQAGKRGLVTQSILFGAVAVVMLFPPLAVLAQVMVASARDGRDPVSFLQLLLQRAQPWMVLTLLVPFALTLSLVWAAKDLVLRRLLASRLGESAS